MTYLEKESGLLTGEPIELYEFIFPDKTYRYNSSDTIYQALGNDWTPISIKRGNIRATSIKGANSVPITAPKNFIPSIKFSDFTTTRIPVKIYRTHRGDIDVFLQGLWYIADVNFTDTSSIIRGASIRNLLQTELPRFFYQFQCNHELYSADCGVVPVFLVGTVITIGKLVGAVFDKRFLTLSATIPSASVLGAITIGNESRMVVEANGTNDIKIMEPFQFASVSDAYSSHDRGCDRSYQECIVLFDNGNRFGGMPFIPKRNIMAGGL